MTKEKFIFELIDKWLYLVSQQCILMENYLQKDRTVEYEKCANTLKWCIDYYDQVYEKVDQNSYSEELIETKLEYMILSLRNETIKNIIAEIKNELCMKIDNKDEFLDKHLFRNEEGKEQDITEDVLVRFITCLRENEEEYC